MNATKQNDPWTDDLLATLREQALGSPSYGSLMLHAADRIANLESLLAEKQRQCDKLTDRVSALTDAIEESLAWPGTQTSTDKLRAAL